MTAANLEIERKFRLRGAPSAADLAAHFSRSRGNLRVPVLMVPVEQLQRIPGMEAGLVRHGGGELLWGEPDRALALLPSLKP